MNDDEPIFVIHMKGNKKCEIYTGGRIEGFPCEIVCIENCILLLKQYAEGLNFRLSNSSDNA